MLTNERDKNTKLFLENSNQKEMIYNLERKIKTKDQEIVCLKKELQSVINTSSQTMPISSVIKAKSNFKSKIKAMFSFA